MKISTDRLFQDYPSDRCPIPTEKTLELEVDGSKLYGEIYLPGAIYDAPHPCVLLFHGFPGVVSNDDLAHSWRRAGFVVMRLFHRGAGPSQGKYSISHCLEDAAALAEYARNEAVKTYDLDPAAIFLAGHSMGGNTVLNTTRRLAWIKGSILMAPYDLAYPMEYGDRQSLKDMIASSDGYQLGLYSAEEQARVYHDIEERWQELRFTQAVPDLAKRNLLVVGGKYDTVAPVEFCVEPMWQELKAQDRETAKPGDHTKILLDGDHGFGACRIELATRTGEWMAHLLD